jgi:hypothetical protein
VWPRLGPGHHAGRPGYGRGVRRPASPFTAFIGYEWTSLAKGNNLHHNVIFRDNGDKADQLVPYTTMKPLGSDNPRDLWKWMHACEDKTGGDAVSSRRPRSCEGTNSTRAP